MKHPNKLRYYRLRKGLSEKQVAEYMGLKSSKAVVSWESGETMPKNAYLGLKLAGLYGVKLDDLYPQLARHVKKEMIATKKKLRLR